MTDSPDVEVPIFARKHRRPLSVALWGVWFLYGVKHFGQVVAGGEAGDIALDLAFMGPVWLLSALLVRGAVNSLTAGERRADAVRFVRPLRHMWLGSVFVGGVAVVSVYAGGVLRNVDVPTFIHHAWAAGHYLIMAWLIVAGVVTSIWARRRLQEIEQGLSGAPR